MSLFSEIVITPSTANRLPQTEENEVLIRRILKEGLSAYAFLMPQIELDNLYRQHPDWTPNDAAIARKDLLEQLPPEVLDRLFPAPPVVRERPSGIIPPMVPPKKEEEEEENSNGGAVRERGLELSLPAVSPEVVKTEAPKEELTPQEQFRADFKIMLDRKLREAAEMARWSPSQRDRGHDLSR